MWYEFLHRFLFLTVVSNYYTEKSQCYKNHIWKTFFWEAFFLHERFQCEFSLYLLVTNCNHRDSSFHELIAYAFSKCPLQNNNLWSKNSLLKGPFFHDLMNMQSQLTSWEQFKPQIWHVIGLFFSWTLLCLVPKKLSQIPHLKGFVFLWTIVFCFGFFPCHVWSKIFPHLIWVFPKLPR